MVQVYVSGSRTWRFGTGTWEGTEALGRQLAVAGSLMATSSSAADLVAAGVQDACEDACSICLEPFSQEEPATVSGLLVSRMLTDVMDWND